jgi:hypothetical protein
MCSGGGFGAGGDAEFGEDPRDVCRHGVAADEEFGGDLRDGMSAREYP